MMSNAHTTAQWGTLVIRDTKEAEPRNVPLSGSNALVVGRTKKAHPATPQRLALACPHVTIGILPQADVVLPVQLISFVHCTIHADTKELGTDLSWRPCVVLIDT